MIHAILLLLVSVQKLNDMVSVVHVILRPSDLLHVCVENGKHIVSLLVQPSVVFLFLGLSLESSSFGDLSLSSSLFVSSFFSDSCLVMVLDVLTDLEVVNFEFFLVDDAVSILITCLRYFSSFFTSDGVSNLLLRVERSPDPLSKLSRFFFLQAA